MVDPIDEAARLLAALIACPALAHGYTDAPTQQIMRDTRAWLERHEESHASGLVSPLLTGSGIQRVWRSEDERATADAEAARVERIIDAIHGHDDEPN